MKVLDNESLWCYPWISSLSEDISFSSMDGALLIMDNISCSDHLIWMVPTGCSCNFVLLQKLERCFSVKHTYNHTTYLINKIKVRGIDLHYFNLVS